MDNNILVQYDGGGYSGCIWEWNFFYIDKDGKFEDIQSSGCRAITTKLAAMILVNDGKNSFSSNVYIYHLDNDIEMLEFAKETNSVLVAGIVKWYNDYNMPDVQPFGICSDCGWHIENYDDMYLENWHGCGGIASTADALLCSDCYCIGVCGCCDDYVGKDGLTWLDGEYNFDDDYENKAARQMFDDGYSDICKDCLDYCAEQIEQDEHSDMLFASLTTGQPDMFSDSMWWLWKGAIIASGRPTAEQKNL